MTTRNPWGWRALAVCLSLIPFNGALLGASAVVLGWNNLGMHCMDSDYSVFSILPPYNTIEANLIVNGGLVTSGSGYTVTYEAIADPDGSINRSSIGKGNFFAFTPFLYGTLAPNTGLAGWSMPGPNNVPQNMRFENYNSPAAGVSTLVNWWRAEGIPITPFDDAMQRNEYPLMRLTARNAAGTVIATSDIVLPVSDEMDCRMCHASGSGAAAQPLAGWVNDPNPERDYRLNILRLHDQNQFLAHKTLYSQALATNGFNASGLYANVVSNGHPIACAACHTSEALQGSGLPGIPPLTASVHSLHAGVIDPVLNMSLNSSVNRAACYRCHPGSTTKCLRGAMGSAVASDGTMAMQCQSCHGSMSQVGSPNRVGWFMEPACQSCHSGTATHNNGQIRYTSVFTDSSGTVVRTAVDQTFATTPNTPATGLSLYRFSRGHAGLQCSACHGSTHAEFPSAFRNDNINSVELQGHVGMIAECTACHTTMPSTITGGPHGLHPIGTQWVSQHESAASGNAAACQVCHGVDYRGTVLSVMKADRTLAGQFAFRGAIIGCYMCHNGPSGSGSPGPAPTVNSVSASTTAGQSVRIPITVTGTNATLRIISQATYGTVGLVGTVATYFPEPGFTGTDTFTFAAYNGSRNSNLGTGTVTVGTGGSVAPTIAVQPVSQTVTAGATVTFTVTATGTPPLYYQWQKNSANISGATTTSLVLANVSSSDAANYRVIVSNAVASVVSATASLTVNPVASTPPTITSQPVSQTVNAGATASFSVGASGTAPLAYQWQKNGTNMPGRTTATLTLASVTTADAAGYRAVVSNSAGSATSATATLTVNPVAFAVAITSPTNGAVFLEHTSITISAGVNSTAAIARVNFYDGTSLIGSDTSSPFSITVSFGSGTHVLTARATNTSGITVVSSPVTITVRSDSSDTLASASLSAE